MKSKNWIQTALKKHKSGALHRQLGIPVNEKIPEEILVSIVETPKNGKGESYLTYKGKTRKIKVTTLLRRRAQLALNLERLNK